MNAHKPYEWRQSERRLAFLCARLFGVLVFVLSPGCMSESAAPAQLCIEGDCASGRGRRADYVRLYEGEFKDGAPHGQGRMRWSDGREYEGEWRAGEPAGAGLYRFPDGAEYEGGVRGGRPNGRGRMRFPDGRVLDGVFEEGYFVGP